MKKCLLVCAGLLALVAVPAAHAGRVEADPNKEYPISPEAGPYVICVKAYAGPDAHSLANRLALHLRQNDWHAYVYDYTAEERRKAQEWLDERYKNVPPEARPHKTIRVQEQWGVLIGGYSDFDSASKDIPRVKKTPEPPEDPGFIDAQFIDQESKQIYRLHAYAQCIATRNPTMRQQQQQVDHNGPDPSWKQLNDGRPYNLLKKCGKPWTLAVAQFQGTGVVQPRSAGSQFLDMIGMGGKSGDVLEASAAQAEEVARFLSSKPYNLKAFVLHTRTGSIVTVGAYDTMDDDDLVRKAKLLAGKPIGATGIKFFDQPRPMQVPQL
jgi:YD repeat-containing protein